MKGRIVQRYFNRMQSFCCLLILFFALASCATSQQNTGAVFPGAGWEASSSPQRNAACRDAIGNVRNYLQTLDTTALMAVKDGRVLLGYGPVEKTSILFSARKSILAMMFGKYVANGTIILDKTLADVGIDDVGGLQPIERQASLRDLLAARSGVYHAAANGGDDLAFAPARGSQIPGSYFLYNNWDFNAVGSAFEMLTHRSIYQTFADDLAAPLQLEDFDFQVHRRSGDSTKSEHLAYHFFLSTRDMARLGYLMVQLGNWKGQQVVPADWVKTMTSQVTPSTEMHPAHAVKRHLGYGYLWWLLELPSASPLSGSYMAWGVHGQYILVIPKQHMVIAHKRQVPEAGRWDVSWVQPADFLHAATMLATAPCD